MNEEEGVRTLVDTKSTGFFHLIDEFHPSERPKLGHQDKIHVLILSRLTTPAPPHKKRFRILRRFSKFRNGTVFKNLSI